MDTNGVEPGKPTVSWQASGLPGSHYIEEAAYMCQMLKVGAGARGMLKAGTVPFLIHTTLKGWHHVASRGHFGNARIMAGKRHIGRWAHTWPQGRHGAFGHKLYNEGATDLFPMRCLASTFCPSVPFAPSRTLPRHGLREGLFLTSVGTRVRPYRTLGERPIGLHPRSYRTLGCVSGGVWHGIAGDSRRGQCALYGILPDNTCASTAKAWI